MRAPESGASSTALDRLVGVIAEVCAIAPDSVQPDAYLLAYDIDSLRAVDLFLAIEEAFDVRVPEQDSRQQRIRTVRDLAAYVDLLRRQVPS